MIEVELTGWKQLNKWLPVALAAVVFLAVTGYFFTTTDDEGAPQVLSWTEWQVQKAERAYQAELADLRREADLMTEALDQDPDPVRAQIFLDRILRRYKDGQPALAEQREAVMIAAQAARDWSVGILDRQPAVKALQAAIRSLSDNKAPEDATEAPVPVLFALFIPFVTTAGKVHPYPAP